MHLLTRWLLDNADESKPALTRREGRVEVITVRMASQTNLIFGLTGASETSTAASRPVFCKGVRDRRTWNGAPG